MKKFLLLCLALICTPMVAKAEGIIGTITFTTSATKNNQTTAVPFIINNPKVTIQCTVDSYVCVDSEVCTSATGFYVAAQPVAHPTDIIQRSAVYDGGTATTYFVSAIPVSGTTGACKVMGRTGRE